jgi:hypothetical protein
LICHLNWRVSFRKGNAQQLDDWSSLAKVQQASFHWSRHASVEIVPEMIYLDAQPLKRGETVAAQLLRARQLGPLGKLGRIIAIGKLDRGRVHMEDTAPHHPSCSSWQVEPFCEIRWQRHPRNVSDLLGDHEALLSQIHMPRRPAAGTVRAQVRADVQDRALRADNVAAAGAVQDPWGHGDAAA